MSSDVISQNFYLSSTTAFVKLSGCRKSVAVYEKVRHLQAMFTELEKCTKPVIGCVHNACVGGGVDLITATDVRLCTQDAWFCVKGTVKYIAYLCVRE